MSTPGDFVPQTSGLANVDALGPDDVGDEVGGSGLLGDDLADNGAGENALAASSLVSEELREEDVTRRNLAEADGAALGVDDASVPAPIPVRRHSFDDLESARPVALPGLIAVALAAIAAALWMGHRGVGNPAEHGVPLPTATIETTVETTEPGTGLLEDPVATVTIDPADPEITLTVPIEPTD